MEVLYFLSKYDADAPRFYLTATLPGARNTEFSWESCLERNNDELVVTWSNLANRMLSYAYKRFDSRVPEPGELDDEDRALLDKVLEGPREGELVAAHADVANAEAALRQAQLAYDRVKNDPHIAALPESLQLEQATNAYSAAKSRLEAMEEGATAADIDADRPAWPRPAPGWRR